MGYKTARAGVDAPVVIPLRLGTPILISFSGFIGVQGYIGAFIVIEGRAGVNVRLASPLVLGDARVNVITAWVADIRWDIYKREYILEINPGVETHFSFRDGHLQ